MSEDLLPQIVIIPYYYAGVRCWEFFYHYLGLHGLRMELAKNGYRMGDEVCRVEGKSKSCQSDFCRNIYKLLVLMQRLALGQDVPLYFTAHDFGHLGNRNKSSKQ